MDSRMITVESGFQYSVNLKYDVSNPARTRTYIPTESFMSLASDILESLQSNSTSRSRIVVGPYGTGKSHLVTVLASLLKHNHKDDEYAPLLDKLEEARHGGLKDGVQSMLRENPFLTVILDPDDGDLNRIFTRGLKQALRDAGLETLMPKTAFKTVEDTLILWQEQYHDVFDRFKEILRHDYRLTVDSFLTMISNYDFRSIEIFRTIFPVLSAGAAFDPYQTKDVPTMFQDVSASLQDHKYRGIYVFFDEFNKVLENAVYSKRVVDLKLLQDFAEMCNRSGDTQVHLMLISHQHMSQYASALPEEILNTWQKVEGRYNAVNVRQGSAKTYQLISAVIKKDPDQWVEYLAQHHSAFSKLLRATKEMSLFGELTDKELEQWILYGCYPLHPATVFVLPRVCNRIAQNERTLFTFLATNDRHTLGRFLEDADHECFKMLTIDKVFDYFLESAIKKRDADSLGSTFLIANEVIARLGSNPSPMSVKIIKGLAIMIGLEEPGFVPTSELLRFSLVHDEADEIVFKASLKELIENKFVYERRSDGRIHFLTGSDVDFDEAIQGIKGNYRYANMFHICSILNEFFAPYPIIANRYNDEFEMTRFFYQEFFLAAEIMAGFDWDDYLISKDYADGVVAHIVCETEAQHREIEQYVQRDGHPQVVFVIPNEPLYDLADLAYDYQALHLLSKDKSFLEQDPYTMVELEALLADYEEQVQIALKSLVDYRSQEKVVFYGSGKRRAIRSRAGLSKLVSEICLNVFSLTPKINNELINRETVTRTIANARKKVVLALLSGVRKPQLGLKGFGPDVSIFRSLLKRPGIYREEGKHVEVSVDDRVVHEFLPVLKVIQESLRSSEAHPISFGCLFNTLRLPPYGLRLGVMPVFLAIAFRDLKTRLLIRDKDGLERPLDAELLESISKSPNHYTVEVIGLDQAKEQYLEQLSRLFEEYLPSDTLSHNYAYPVGLAMKRWFVSLPRYTRESRKHSEFARALVRLLSLPMNDSTDLLFRKIPNLVTESDDFRVDDIQKYVHRIREIKEELETHLIYVRAQLLEIVKKCFCVSSEDGSNANIVARWYASLNERTKNFAFSGTALKLMNMAKSLEEENYKSVLDELISIMVGLDLVDWSDDVRDRFEDELDRTIRTILNVENDSVPEVHHRVTFMSDDQEISERVYVKVEIGPLGQVLYSELASSLDGFADAITMDEKRQVLLDLLKNLS